LQGVRSSFGRVQDISRGDSKNQCRANRKQECGAYCDPYRHHRQPILAAIFVGALRSGKGQP
jgi:hypothetical protein